MSKLRTLLPFLSPFKWYCAGNVVFNILSILFSAVSIIMIIPFLEVLFEMTEPVLVRPEFSLNPNTIKDLFYYELNSWMGQSGSKEAGLVFICIVLIGAFFFKNITRYLALYFLSPIRNGVVVSIRKKLYRKILALPLSYFSKERKGDIITRATSDVNEIEHSILGMIEALVKSPATILLYMGLLMIISAKLTLFVLVLVVIMAVVLGQVGKQLKKQAWQGQSRLSMMTSSIEEALSGLRIIKAFRAEDYQIGRIEEEGNAFFRITNKVYRRRDLASPLTEFLAIAILSVVIWYGGSMVLNETISPSIFIGYLLLYGNLVPPAKSFSTAMYNIRKGMASMDRINEVLESEMSIPEKDEAQEISLFNDSITYQNVSFIYPGSEVKVLDGIQLTLKKGQMLALVGQSGAGKTTLADLLPRFYDVTHGEIRIDDTDIRDVRLADLRSLMGVVSQEPILFNDTVHNNIAFGKQSITREEVIAAAKAGNAHGFIEKLPDGYDTVIGDRGNTLSGGERQRLTIARAILQNPPILILDEATSSLDAESEKLVQDALNNLMESRTSIVIAHRLSTIQNADEILVLQNGKIAERGNHQSLLAAGGLYKKLVELQGFG